MEQNEAKYNGWTNYETWRVNLELFDGWDIMCTWSEDEWLETMRSEYETINQAHRSAIDAETKASFFSIYMSAWLADYLKSYPEMMIEESKEDCQILRGWMETFLDRVNFREIADHHLQEDEMYMSALQQILDGAEVLK